MNRNLIIYTLILFLLAGCDKKSGYSFGDDSDSTNSDSVTVISTEDDSQNNESNVSGTTSSSEFRPTDKEQVLKPSSSSNADNEIISRIRSRVMSLRIIKQANYDIQESTSGSRRISLIIEPNKDNTQNYDIRYGVNGDDHFETYGTLLYNTSNDQIQEFDPISGSYNDVN